MKQWVEAHFCDVIWTAKKKEVSFKTLVLFKRFEQQSKYRFIDPLYLSGRE